ncbi:CPBP family glutamic-type intramembrane protease [Glycocaulis sp.]|uniref:CPBP family glutamic-type intramembrane protease n=1 Tax=Glycocaulis sp. TaxID=1969725 RepID=UPI003D19C3E0
MNTQSSEIPVGRGSALVRVIIMAAVLVAILSGLGWISANILQPNLPNMAVAGLRAVLTSLLVMGIVWLMHRRLQRRSWSELGFVRTSSAIITFLFGAAFWIVLAAGGIMAGVYLGYIELAISPFSLTALGIVVFHILVVFFYEALPEETAIRGYIMNQLDDAAGLLVAVIGQAIFFMLFAFGLVALSNLLGLGTGWEIGTDRVILFLSFGITLALLRIWTGSLWTAMGFHTAFQTTIQLMGQNRFISVNPADAASFNEIAIFSWMSAIALGGVIALIAVLLKRRRTGRAV